MAGYETQDLGCPLKVIIVSMADVYMGQGFFIGLPQEGTYNVFFHSLGMQKFSF